MRIAVPKERAPDERRVALIPDAVARLRKAGVEVAVERSAGTAAGFPDAAYEAAGAVLVGDAATACAGADLVVRVQRPPADEIPLLPEGSALVGFLQPGSDPAWLEALTARRVTGLSMERVPRITRAQSMDALSSQATVAGYKAVLLGAAAMPRLLPMLTTAAGTLAPARAFILGAGVAGLQAIATARRLGAIVAAFDVRPAVKEQVESLGASFLAAEAVSQEAETEGGYAKELGEEQHRRELELIGNHLPEMDLVITTAQIPGRPAPRLILKDMVAAMKPGAVIVDLAADSGGNCELTRAGETVQVGGVSIIGARNLPATVPLHASQMYSRNLLTLIEYLLKDGTLVIDLEDPITGPMCLTHAGAVRAGKGAA